MMTPKEALIKDGTIAVKEGRGRLSREAIERCKELVSQGWDIKGYEVSKPNVKSTASEPVVKKVKATNVKEVVELAPYRYDEAKFKAVTAEGEVFGMREACNNCGYSLCGHICENPSVLGKVVKILPR